MTPTPEFEIAIVGGGPAGLSAALILGRSRRATVLFDAGAPRNAPAAGAHNVFTRDGTSPHELHRIGRQQLTPYPSVAVREVQVVDAARAEDGTFVLTDADGRRTTAAQVILATGVVDELPPIDGLRALWGSGVFHCPYCHGWEVQDRPFVLLAQSPHALQLARALRGWSTDLTICPVPPFVIDAEEQRALSELGVRFRAPVQRLVAGSDGTVADVVLTTGEHLGPAAVFTSAPVRQRSHLPEKLGCLLHTEGMFAGQIQVDDHGATGVPGLYAVGDAAQGPQQVIVAAAEGTMMGGFVNGMLLLAGDLPRGVVAQGTKGA